MSADSMCALANSVEERPYVDKVTVEVNPLLARCVRSRVFIFVAALQGVCVSFAPLFLYWSGKGTFYPGYEWLFVPLCFVVIWGVPSVYFALANPVVKQLRERSATKPV
jgi:predicted cation transporter